MHRYYAMAEFMKSSQKKEVQDVMDSAKATDADPDHHPSQVFTQPGKMAMEKGKELYRSSGLAAIQEEYEGEIGEE